jgi:hypothetical protein
LSLQRDERFAAALRRAIFGDLSAPGDETTREEREAWAAARSARRTINNGAERLIEWAGRLESAGMGIPEAAFRAHDLRFAAEIMKMRPNPGTKAGFGHFLLALDTQQEQGLIKTIIEAAFDRIAGSSEVEDYKQREAWDNGVMESAATTLAFIYAPLVGEMAIGDVLEAVFPTDTLRAYRKILKDEAYAPAPKWMIEQGAARFMAHFGLN